MPPQLLPEALLGRTLGQLGSGPAGHATRRSPSGSMIEPAECWPGPPGGSPPARTPNRLLRQAEAVPETANATSSAAIARGRAAAQSRKPAVTPSDSPLRSAALVLGPAPTPVGLHNLERFKYRSGRRDRHKACPLPTSPPTHKGPRRRRTIRTPPGDLPRKHSIIFGNRFVDHAGDGNLRLAFGGQAHAESGTDKSHDRLLARGMGGESPAQERNI